MSQQLLIRFVAVLTCFPSLVSASDALTCTSPDGQNVLSLKLVDGQPHYDVTYGGQAVIRDSALGLNLDEKPFGAFGVVGTETDSVDTVWKPVVGERETVRDHYNRLVVQLQEQEAPQRQLHIECRAFDEGVAFRYVLPKQPALDGATVSSEATEFRFARDFGAYPIPWTEDHYQETTTPINACESVLIPLTIELGNGAMATLIEAHVANQPPCTLKKKAERTLRPHFRKGKLTLATPEALTWRGFILAPNAAGLIERRYLVENLNPPCAIADTSWIKPGKFIDRSGPVETDNIKKNMDFAAEHNIGYVHIDWSWYGTERKWSDEAIAHFREHMPEKTRKKLAGQDWIKNTTGDPTTVASGYVPYLQFMTRFYGSISHIDIDMPEVIRYGQAKGVGLSLYVNGGTLKPYGDHDVELVWKTLSGWGVTALKPGFVACNNQEDIQWLRRLVALAAKYKLVLNIHDGYIADGLRRTYPNLLTQEGGGGRETNPPITHELMLPFTRHLIGTHDHTPTLYSGADGRTKLFELAQLVVYHGARQSIRNAYGSRNQFGPEIEFLEKVPTVWDDVAVLAAEPGDCIVIARRSGRRWFIGGMNDEDARQVKLPLDFLQKSTPYRATVFSDVAGARDAQREVIQATSASVLDVTMAPRGGVAVIIEPVAGPAKKASAAKPFNFEEASRDVPKPREIYPIVKRDMIPGDLKIVSDEIVTSDTDPTKKLRKITAHFNSLKLEGRVWGHPCVILMPADPSINLTPERKGKVVIIGSPDGAMFPAHVAKYGEPIATRTGYPTMVLSTPGVHPDGARIEGRNMDVLHRMRKETGTNYYNMNCQLALIYIRAMDMFETVLGVDRVSAVVGGHSKRGRSATVAAAMDSRVASPIILGNEGVYRTDQIQWHLSFHHGFFQDQVSVPVFYIGATNEDGYNMFNINLLQQRLRQPMTIEMIPNYRHYNFHEIQFIDFMMWVAHIFDDRPISRIAEMSYERRDGRNYYRAKIESEAKIQIVRTWFVYADNPEWRGLTWFEWIMQKNGDTYETSVPGQKPDAYMIEVADTAMGFPGYVTSLPTKLTDAPLVDRNTRDAGWLGPRSRER